MSVDPNASGGGNVGTIIQAGQAVAKWANRILGTGEDKRERAQWEAAERAGYSTRPGRFPVVLDPQGNVTTPDKAREVGRSVIVASGRTSKEQAEADAAYRRSVREDEALTRQREREKRQQQTKQEESRRAQREERARRPQSRFGRIVDATTAILVGTGAADVIRDVFDMPEPRTSAPPTPPPAPPVLPPGGKEPAARPELPNYGPFGGPWTTPKLPPTVPSPPLEPPRTTPGLPEAPPPVNKAAWEPVLTGVAIYRDRIPLPSRPTSARAMPGGAPVASGATLPKVPLWKQVAPYLAPLALTALMPSSSSKKRREPLTTGQPDALLSYSPASMPLPFPGSGFGGSGPGSSSSTCECKPKANRSKRRKRKREVCYSGRYIERSSGISKTKLRKVTCR